MNNMQFNQIKSLWLIKPAYLCTNTKLGYVFVSIFTQFWKF